MTIMWTNLSPGLRCAFNRERMFCLFNKFEILRWQIDTAWRTKFYFETSKNALVWSQFYTECIADLWKELGQPATA